MGRMIRFVPPRGALVEITYRTVQRRFLLKPGHDFNQIVVGAIARAKRLYEVEIYGVVVMSNHLHLLIGVLDALQMSRFMNYFGSKLAKEVARRTGWREKIWSRRYRAVVVSEEETAQVARLRYLLAHGTKERLVHHPRQWPGVHCARPLVSGETLHGVWPDRTRESLGRRGKRGTQRVSFEIEPLRLDPLPCWRHLEAQEIRRRVGEMLEEIESEARQQAGPVLGLAAISRQCPFAQPLEPSERQTEPAPVFHAASKKARQALMEGYRHFQEAFVLGAKKLQRAGPPAGFPIGSFPPSPPFVASSGL